MNSFLPPLMPARLVVEPFIPAGHSRNLRDNHSKSFAISFKRLRLHRAGRFDRRDELADCANTVRDSRLLAFGFPHFHNGRPTLGEQSEIQVTGTTGSRVPVRRSEIYPLATSRVLEAHLPCWNFHTPTAAGEGSLLELGLPKRLMRLRSTRRRFSRCRCATSVPLLWR
jgi:hypothetical protein